MSAATLLLAAIRRYGNFRENIGGMYLTVELRKRKKQEWLRVQNAVSRFLYRSKS